MATEKAIASSRLLWIDVLKGFAIILVVVGHQPEHIPEIIYVVPTSLIDNFLIQN